MNILWQNEHYPDATKGGGGAINTYYIVTAMQQLGHNVVILARGENGVQPFREVVNGTTVQRLARPKMPDKLWRIWPLLEPAYSKKSIGSVSGGYDAFVGVDYSFALNTRKCFPDRPLLYRVEGNERSHQAAIAALRNGKGSGRADQKGSFLECCLAAQNDLMERLVWKKCHAMIVKSQFMKRELQSWYGVDTRNVFVIPNGVDFERYARAKRNKQTLAHLGNPLGEKVVIISCGRLVPMKNVHFLIRAFSQMKQRENCILAIVGNGQEQSDLKAEASGLGIGGSVKFIGHVEAVEDFLAAADIFVLPSVYEPFGNALVEAMAAGLPSVALRPDMRKVRTASEEILEHGATGYLVSGDEYQDFSGALDRLVASRELRLKLGREAQARCQREYSWEACARAYLALMENGSAKMVSD